MLIEKKKNFSFISCNCAFPFLLSFFFCRLKEIYKLLCRKKNLKETLLKVTNFLAENWYMYFIKLDILENGYEKKVYKNWETENFLNVLILVFLIKKWKIYTFFNGFIFFENLKIFENVMADNVGNRIISWFFFVVSNCLIAAFN